MIRNAELLLANDPINEAKGVCLFSPEEFLRTLKSLKPLSERPRNSDTSRHGLLKNFRTVVGTEIERNLAG